VTILFDGIAWILSFLYDLWPSYGGAIILLTLLVMAVTTPLTLKGTRSMMAMQRLQPEMKRIQDRYKDDREKLNAELLQFYKDNEISPVSGCLPLLIQMPVFIVLYRVISGLTVPASDLGVQIGWTGGQVEAGDALTQVPDQVTDMPFEPAYLDHSSSLYQALNGSYEMPFLGLNLAESASTALSQGIAHAVPYLVMIGIVALSGWYQQKQTMARSTSEQTQQQKTISRVMLIFLPVISFGLPAGVVLYFVVSNLYRVGLQTYITRTHFKTPLDLGSDGDGKGKGGSPKGGDTGPKGKGPGPKAGRDDGGRATATKTATSKQTKGSGGGGRKGGTNGSGARRSTPSKKKTFTSDPKKRAPAVPQQAEPRARKKRR
jgi:YidC/Oxa1 family membrane protein insertase